MSFTHRRAYEAYFPCVRETLSVYFFCLVLNNLKKYLFNFFLSNPGLSLTRDRQKSSQQREGDFSRK